jgi:hypothetical protein
VTRTIANWRCALAAMSGVLALAGCSSDDNVTQEAPAATTTASASPVSDWRAAASEALTAWDDFPVDAAHRPIVVLQDTVGPSGFHTDEGKIAFMSGNWSPPDSLPSSPDEVDGYPVISAQEALDRLRTADGNGGGKPEGTAMTVQDMRLGKVEVRTDRGPMTLPAWRVMFSDSLGPNWVPAVAPPATFRHAGYSYREAGATTGNGSRELTIHTAVSDGSGPCGGTVSVETVESAHAVAYRLIVTPNPRGNDLVGCAYDAGGGQDVTVTLAAPLGNRVLVDVPGPDDVRGAVPVVVKP